MAGLTLTEFADRMGEVMPMMMREFFKHQSSSFYKTKLTMPQFAVMDILNRLDEARMTELANYMHVTTAAMTGIVNRLVRDGYIARRSDPDDRRIVRVNLTAKGSRIVKDAVEKRKAMTVKMFGMISQKEREQYLKILTNIAQHIKEQK